MWHKDEYSLAYKIFKEVKTLVKLYRSNSINALFKEQKTKEIRETIVKIQSYLDILYKMECEKDPTVLWHKDWNKD